MSSLKTNYIKFAILIALLCWETKVWSQKLLKGKIILSDNKKYEASVLYNPQHVFGKVTIKDSSGFKTFLPIDIKGYEMNKRKFISVITKKGDSLDTTTSFFIEQLVDGAAELYYYPGYAINNKEIYLFRKKGEKQYMSIEKNINTKKTVGPIEFVNGSQQGISGIPIFLTLSFADEKSFLNYFERYFSDCFLIRNKIKEEYYSASSLEYIFMDYNQCK